MRGLVCYMFLLAERMREGRMNPHERPRPLGTVFCNAKNLAGSHMSSFGYSLRTLHVKARCDVVRVLGH